MAMTGKTLYKKRAKRTFIQYLRSEMNFSKSRIKSILNSDEQFYWKEQYEGSKKDAKARLIIIDETRKSRKKKLLGAEFRANTNKRLAKEGFRMRI